MSRARARLCSIGAEATRISRSSSCRSDDVATKCSSYTCSADFRYAASMTYTRRTAQGGLVTPSLERWPAHTIDPVVRVDESCTSTRASGARSNLPLQFVYGHRNSKKALAARCRMCRCPTGETPSQSSNLRSNWRLATDGKTVCIGNAAARSRRHCSLADTCGRSTIRVLRRIKRYSEAKAKRGTPAAAGARRRRFHGAARVARLNTGDCHRHHRSDRRDPRLR